MTSQTVKSCINTGSRELKAVELVKCSDILLTLQRSLTSKEFRIFLTFTYLSISWEKLKAVGN